VFYPKFEEQELKEYLCKIDGKRAIDDEEFNRRRQVAQDALAQVDFEQKYVDRRVDGDASETGLVKFVQPLLDIEKARSKYEVFETEKRQVEGSQADVGEGKIKKEKCLIPFSSEIKFNLFVRKCNRESEMGWTEVCKDADQESKDNHGSDKLMVVIKGAPEKILDRCTKVLMYGEERDFAPYKAQYKAANDGFGKLGERVLAFAWCMLDPAQYPQHPPYPFDMKNWKQFGEKPEGAKNTDHPGYFPMWDFTLVGLVSLNDPPRPRVDISVEKCRSAGIKVIMVTGDQPPTAAAIAHKVNIIKNQDLIYMNLLETIDETTGEKYTPEKAWEKATAVVVHGNELAEKHLAEEEEQVSELEKGKYLQEWISKKEVVFARTTPSQKLLIVAACQKAGHVVAVTGDGVNDSPAIKKADIGIAMGSGSDVAKNAADMLLLDDDFSSIVNGVEEGRLIFDNLKKSIAYTLSSNIPEISPFIMFILLQVPLPLSTVLILCIDLGTDMVPAISFAYENPELDIMSRHPRNSKRDHLVNTKLISFSYLQIGMVQAAAGFFTYFYILSDYGLKPATLFFLSNEKGYLPWNNDDKYDPLAINNGNSNFGNPDAYEELDWNGSNDAEVDVRMFYFRRNADSWSKCRWGATDDSVPQFWRISWVSNAQICHSTEALKFAQGGYLISIVCVQWADLLICKTRNLSISQQLMLNNFANFGLFFETSLVALLSYIEALNIGLGTRPVASPHFAIPSFSFFVVIVFYDELRKIYLRNGMERTPEGKIKYNGWVVRNTYY